MIERENTPEQGVLQEALGAAEQKTGTHIEGLHAEAHGGERHVEWEIEGEEGAKILFRLNVDPVTYAVRERTWIKKKDGKETVIRYENVAQSGELALVEEALIAQAKRGTLDKNVH